MFDSHTHSLVVSVGWFQHWIRLSNSVKINKHCLSLTWQKLMVTVWNKSFDLVTVVDQHFLRLISNIRIRCDSNFYGDIAVSVVGAWPVRSFLAGCAKVTYCLTIDLCLWYINIEWGCSFANGLTIDRLFELRLTLRLSPNDSIGYFKYLYKE